MDFNELGKLLVRKRGSMGIRAAAAEMQISPTTLSRIERGHVPDVTTLNKVCSWLGEDPAVFTGIGGLQIAFKKKQAVSAKTAASLAVLIQKASDQFARSIDAEGHDDS